MKKSLINRSFKPEQLAIIKSVVLNGDMESRTEIDTNPDTGQQTAEQCVEVMVGHTKELDPERKSLVAYIDRYPTLFVSTQRMSDIATSGESSQEVVKLRFSLSALNCTLEEFVQWAGEPTIIPEAAQEAAPQDEPVAEPAPADEPADEPEPAAEPVTEPEPAAEQVTEQVAEQPAQPSKKAAAKKAAKKATAKTGKKAASKKAKATKKA